MTDPEIHALITSPKTIISKEPARGYREDNSQRRCDLRLIATTDDATPFRVFIRQSLAFLENFSIGLSYSARTPASGSITLVRYNGPHGEVSREPDGHYAKPHIHHITAEEIAAGSIRPQARQREITDRYATLEQAIAIFFQDTAVANYTQYFPELLQGSLFNGHQQH